MEQQRRQSLQGLPLMVLLASPLLCRSQEDLMPLQTYWPLLVSLWQGESLKSQPRWLSTGEGNITYSGTKESHSPVLGNTSNPWILLPGGFFQGSLRAWSLSLCLSLWKPQKCFKGIRVWTLWHSCQPYHHLHLISTGLRDRHASECVSLSRAQSCWAGGPQDPHRV